LHQAIQNRLTDMRRSSIGVWARRSDAVGRRQRVHLAQCTLSTAWATSSRNCLGRPRSLLVAVYRFHRPGPGTGNVRDGSLAGRIG
jgi:hypothetical protein